MALQRTIFYSRTSDMDPGDHINVVYNTDGSIHLTALSHKVAIVVGFADDAVSPHTRAALLALAEAIERDNFEHPQNR